MPLLSLSNELIANIAEIVHPSSIVNLALTCHRLHDCASTSLTLHRSRQRELRTQHDRHPMNILNLLRKGRISPDVLWYIRVLEFYGGRSTWQAWKTYSDYERMRDEPKVNLTSSGPDIFLDFDLEAFFQGEGLTSIMQDSMERIKKGDDQPLKTILIASCPSLEKVTWVAHVPEPNDQPYSLLCKLISACQPLPGSLWPPGLLSLRSISLGACTEYVHPHDNLHPNLSEFCRLFLLPNLKSLRVNVSGYGDSDLEYLNKHVPARSSSVEEITINICDFDKSTLVAILERCRSLKSYLEIFLGPWANIMEDIQPMFGNCLEELRPEGGNEWNLRLYGDISALSGFTKLRIFTIYVGDLVAGTFTEKSLPAVGKGKKVKWHDFHAVLPPAAEDIIFQWPPRNYHEESRKYRLHKTLFPDFFEHLDEFVRQRGKENGGCLKRMYLGFAQESALVHNIGEKKAVEFQKLIKEWEKIWNEAGVEVVLHGCREGVDDEILECQPTALEWGSDEEEIQANNGSD
ncbi:hypothetical protein N431DRAFT_437329 [Stipitochalara longipes BDJ]|nr:hypothetical protein N431DRAFT_437329 [Stipitochalara longipes BDJ]